MAYQFVLPESVVSFYDYFKLNVPIEEIAKALGFTFQKQAIKLPRATEVFLWESGLQTRLDAIVPLASFTSETARRELLIAPILTEVTRHLGAQIRLEYPINVSSQLRGNLDYLVINKANLLVVEAKYADTERGFVQLTAELAALDKWVQTEDRYLYGAVSIGDTWRFGVLDRQAKTITQDVNFFVVPQGLHDLLPVLVGILRGEGEPVSGGEG